MTNTPKTILLLEDERVLQAAIESKLKKNGFTVILSRSVEQALEYINKGVNIDVVWLDHYLFGEGSGLDFVAKIKENEKYKDVPIFVVSNTATPDKLQTYLRLGAKKYFVKSDHRLEAIVSEIQEYLTSRESK